MVQVLWTGCSVSLDVPNLILLELYRLEILAEKLVGNTFLNRKEGGREGPLSRPS
jgi:hypothetical protein